MEITGERYVPSLNGQIKYEHLHRYALCVDYVAGKSVLDIACGEGYGCALLASVAKSVLGVDINSEVVEYATKEYSTHKNVTFMVGSCDSIPLPDNSVDVVTSFETIEHHDKHEEMMQEIKRVLKPGGILIISSPNRLTYSDEPKYSNPFHVKELYYEELTALLRRYFDYVEIYGQRMAIGSFIFKLENSQANIFQAFTTDANQVKQKVSSLNAPIYFFAICSDKSLTNNPNIDSVYIDSQDDLLNWMEIGWRQTGDVLEQTRLQLQQTQSELQQCQSKLQQTQTELQQSQSQVQQTQTELQQSQSQVQQTQTELQQSQSQVQQTQTELKQSQSQVQQTQTELKQSQSQLQQTQTELKQSQSQLQQTQAELEQSQSQLQQTQTKLKELELELQQMKVNFQNTQNQVEAMETSKFWKLRTQWLKVKKFLNLVNKREMEDKPTSSRELRDVFHNFNNEDWLKVLLQSVKNPIINGIELPGFPSDEIQISSVGSTAKYNLQEAFNFYCIIKKYLSSFDQNLSSDSHVLDFGCGWGRIIRFFLKDVPIDNVYGVDVDEEMINLCRKTVKYGKYNVVNSSPPSNLPSESFDLIYAYSVFSHLNEATHIKWIEEFSRILKPNGLLIVTTRSRSHLDLCRSLREQGSHNDSHAQGLANSFVDYHAALSAYDNGKFLHEATGGGVSRPASFYGETLIPRGYVEREWTRFLIFRDFMYDSAVIPQAIIVMQKAASTIS
ncbi:methyltransferase domain-containing protein [Nostoc sp. DSM 114161]|jgi:ubiquinone/menaquinone biosynthesis C-methylase UbiE/peptidoglycan hydrolase CwlO-like protein|uniref:methyltransferase domain-containing protein n=1 Tax=Nostoc sp. DSM 114161 TaxID=3440143 RepID=UPI0040458EE1